MIFIGFIPFLALLGFHMWQVHNMNKERNEWMRAFLSKDSYEFSQTEPSVTKEIIKESKQPDPLINVEDLDDDEFEKAILN